MEGRHLFLAALAWLTSSEGTAQTLSPPMPWRVLCAGLPSTLTPTPPGERGRPPGGGRWVGREGGRGIPSRSLGWRYTNEETL